MAEEEKEEVKPEENEKPPKNKKKLIIIIVIAVVGVLVLGGGGFFAYKMLADKGTGESRHENEEKADTVIIPFDPFILNLADRGRYLKLSVQVEVANKEQVGAVENKIPQLRDAIIMLISDKSAESISTSEGKFQLKDEILFRVNNVVGINKDLIKNIYFTEFVMQ